MLMETLSRWIGGVNDVLWTYVLVAALLGCAVWFTLRTRGVQFRLSLIHISEPTRPY